MRTSEIAAKPKLMPGGCFRLVAVFQLKTGNDCCQRKPSLHWFVIAGPLYLSKPSLKAGLGRVTAFIGVEIELSTQSGNCRLVKADREERANSVVLRLRRIRWNDGFYR